MKKQVFYIELDALLDTRLGTLRKISDQAADMVLRNGYYSRRSDFFAGIDHDQYRALYEGRDTVTLENSNVTNLISSLDELVQKTFEALTTSINYDTVELMLNIWPYKLDSKFCRELCTAIRYCLNLDLPIQVVNMEPDKVDGQFCSDNLAGLFIYNINDWLNANALKIAEKPIADVSIFAPALFTQCDPSDEQIEEQVKAVMHPLTATEFAFRGLVNLQFIDPKCFSILDPELRPAAL